MRTGDASNNQDSIQLKLAEQGKYFVNCVNRYGTFCATVYFAFRDIKLPLKLTGFVFFQCLLQGELITFAK